MAEPDQPPSLEERIAASPIHQQIDVDGYFTKNQMPEHLRRVFHELILLRGEFPEDASPEQAREFGRRARELTIQYQVKPEEGQPLLMMFTQLIAPWVARRPYRPGDPRLN